MRPGYSIDAIIPLGEAQHFTITSTPQQVLVVPECTLQVQIQSDPELNSEGFIYIGHSVATALQLTCDEKIARGGISIRSPDEEIWIHGNTAGDKVIVSFWRE